MESLNKCLGFCSILIFIGAVADAAVINNGHIHDLVFLGSSADGKSFYSDSTETRNWTEARAFCNASYMELAAIESQAQVDLLLSAAMNGHPGFAERNYWTAARDALKSRQFSWDTNNAQPSENLTLEWIPNWRDQHPFETCAFIQGIEDAPVEDSLVMIIARCGEKYHTLCQSSSTTRVI